jgi:primosomal protein N'
VTQLFPERQAMMHYCAYFDPLPEHADFVIHVTGDALLQFPDVAAEDRTYQMIQSIAGRFPTAHQIIQTYEPSFRVWALWATHQDQVWYEALWQERVDLHIPPGIPGMLARYRGMEGKRMVEEKKAELEADPSKKMTALLLPVQQRSTTHTAIYRILITCTDHVHPATRLHWRSVFPHPWAVDMAPDSWLV